MLKYLSLVLFSFLSLVAVGQPSDSISQAATDTLTAGGNVSDGPYIALGRGKIFISLAIVFFSVTIAITLLLVAGVIVLLGFIALGFVSAGTLHGLRKRSFSAGLRFGLYALLSFVGALFGYMIMLGIRAFFQWKTSMELLSVGGAVVGALAGVLLALVLVRVGRTLFQRFTRSS